ncbi:MAG: hypothetical protein MJ212_05690 [Alphaproteobacteria bacterium]|nr:hypothetical protein [Alphaproteobacteria bacterium]
MNNNIDRITKGLAEACKECITVAYNDPSAKKEILKGGGSNGGIMTRLLMPRPISKMRISEDALKLCLEHNVTPYDYFILTPTQLRKKYNKFFSSNEKTLEKSHSVGHYLTGDHNIPNKAMLLKMLELCENNPSADVSEYREILNNQSYDLISLEEDKKLNQRGLKSSGSMELRDKCCSPKIEFVDLWLTPKDVIKKFFEITKLDKNKCLDPCACDGRWLDGKGLSMDILPMKKNVLKQDFLKYQKSNLPENINTIVGNIPFSLLDDFVEKALELVDDCYFLVNGDTILKHFPNNIEHIYIFSGLEGNQKDNRSRCEFDVPFLIKSALWCCIVHITKKEQPAWIVESDLSNDEKRDGFHVALGKNTFIKSNVEIDKNERITRIPVTSCIMWKGGKKIISDGEIIDLKNFSHLTTE